MTVPYKVNAIKPIKPSKLQENINTFHKELTSIGKGINDALKKRNTYHQMPTLEGSEDWPKLTAEYHLSESNIKPVEGTILELGYEIDRLKKDAAFHKQTLINYQNSTQARMDDYKNLEVDYLNSQTEVKRLQAQIDKIPGLKRTLKWFMNEHLEMDIKLSSVEEKKEVDRTWL